jgi:hypothetical protein
VDDAIENGVGQSGISHEFVPAVDRKRAGDDQRASVVAVLDDLQQIALLLGQQWFGSSVVEYEKVDAAELTHQYALPYGLSGPKIFRSLACHQRQIPSKEGFLFGSSPLIP